MRVALTRTAEDIAKDRVLFEKEGFQVVEIPLIEEVPLDFHVPEVDFDFVLFQSARAVGLFLSKHKLRGEKIIVVGEKTKKAVEEFGYSVWAMPEEYYAEKVLELLKGLSGKVLIPRSAVGREEVIEGLKELGFEVYPLDVYTVREKRYEEQKLLEKLSKVDAVVFASPSAIRGLFANLQKEGIQELLSKKIVVCIGKTTSEFLKRSMGIDCKIPEKPTLEKVVEFLKTLA